MALTAEYAPGHMSARLTTIMSCGLTLGAALGGIAAVRVVPSLGWTSMFWIGGVGPFLILPLLLLFLPESIRFLVVCGGQDGRIAAILRRVDSRLTFAPETRFVLREATAKQGRMRDLFAAGWRIPTLLLWLTVFMNIVIASFYNQWTPTMLNSFGLALGAAQSAAIMFQIGSIFGAFLLGWMADRVGFFWVLGISYLLSAMLSALAVSFGPSAALVLTIVFMQGLTGGAAQCCVNGLSGTFYPTAIRSTGSGWALAVGRCGGVLGPAIGGILMAAQWSIVEIFYVVSIPSFIACLSIITMGVAAARSGVAPQRVEPKEAAFS
jgi:AAHS family 4-hydroxybenzoate transporter-like MFS transporter